jgi:site-specific DNA-methyltransferase (adenine-specific)
MKINWQVRKERIENLKFYEKNPRNFTKKGLEDLKKSIKNCGDANIITINADNTVLGGHARLTVMKDLNIEEVDVKYPDTLLNEKQVEEIVVRLNANTAGEWDMDKLQEHFNIDELGEWGLDVTFVEGDGSEIVEDEVPEEVQTRSKLGDVWQLGRHRVMCGSSTVITDVEKLMGEHKADMLLTDPPYNVNYEGKTKEKLKIDNDQMGNDDFRQFLSDAFSCANAVMKRELFSIFGMRFRRI